MPDLDPQAKEILKLEFEYARETATQAQNDRTTIVNLYLLLVGGVGSAAVGLSQLQLPRGAYVILFGLLGLIGFFTLMKLVRLRQAWQDSARAMNQIKDFYLTRYPDLKEAFLWKTHTIPAPGKLWTITFNLALLVALIDSFSIAVAVHFMGLRVPGADYAVEVFAAFMFFSWQTWFYFYQLSPSEKLNA